MYIYNIYIYIHQLCFSGFIHQFQVSSPAELFPIVWGLMSHVCPRKWTTVSGDLCHQSFSWAHIPAYPKISQQIPTYPNKHGGEFSGMVIAVIAIAIAVRENLWPYEQLGSIIVQGTEIQSITMKNSSLVILASWETCLTYQTCRCVWKWGIPGIQ